MIFWGEYNYNPDRIFLNDITFDNEDEVIVTTAHESGHFLHPFARQYIKGLKEKPRNHMLSEIICHLGMLVYFSLNHGEKNLEYHERVRRQLNYSELVARDIFNSDYSLLGKIATRDMWSARLLIIPCLQRPLYGEKSPRDIPSEK